MNSPQEVKSFVAKDCKGSLFSSGLSDKLMIIGRRDLTGRSVCGCSLVCLSGVVDKGEKLRYLRRRDLDRERARTTQQIMNYESISHMLNDDFLITKTFLTEIFDFRS